VTEALSVRVHAEVQQMRLAGCDRHDAVRRNATADVEHEALIAGQQAVAKDSEAPGKLVGGALDCGHRLQVGRLHEPDFGTWLDGGAHCGFRSRSLTMHRSAQAVALASGLRS